MLPTSPEPVSQKAYFLMYNFQGSQQLERPTLFGSLDHQRFKARMGVGSGVRGWGGREGSVKSSPHGRLQYP